MIFIVTGVSGSGKTTLGKALARRLGIAFYDGDDFHALEAIERMRSGLPLEDSHRWPWLERMNVLLRKAESRRSLVLACSALREVYRSRLAEGLGPGALCWVHLQGPTPLLRVRMQDRVGHFMPASLLDSQLAIYETPQVGLILSATELPEVLVERIIQSVRPPGAEIGIMGMGVMGQSLARNIAGKGFQTALYNRHLSGSEEEVAVLARDAFPELHSAYAFDDLEDFVRAIAPPRKILLMVEAGSVVDSLLTLLIPLLEPGDTLVDGGNSHFRDTAARQQLLAQRGISFVGAGISGGAEGALLGPAIMAGGCRKGFGVMEEIFRAMAARNRSGESCCAYLGDGGAGHFVKMVHNGIEYAEMQLLAEIYEYLRVDRAMSAHTIADLFRQWGLAGEHSFLLEITAEILRCKCPDGSLLLDVIAPRAATKGSGGWAVATACELGISVPTIAAALFARFQSSGGLFFKDYPPGKVQGEGFAAPESLRYLYRFIRLTNYVQGFHLIRAGAETFGWQIVFDDVLKIWSAGCILRSELLEDFRNTLQGEEIPGLTWLEDYFASGAAFLQQTEQEMAAGTCSIPLIRAGMAYARALSRPGNEGIPLIQAQRDYFGAHGYERRDAPAGQRFHTVWKK